MDISGKIIQVLPTQTGEGKNGPWKKQEFVLEIPGQYPKKLCVSAWGDKFPDGLIGANKDVTVHFDLESREYNGRWYTDVRAWKIETGSTSSTPTAGNGPSEIPAPPANFASDDSSEDLPF